MTTRTRYTQAQSALREGLWIVLSDISTNELDGKTPQEVVLLAGQQLQGLVAQIEKILKGVNDGETTVVTTV